MFETERLILRRFTDDDASAIARLRGDAKFMRHIKPVESSAQAKSWMRMVSRYWSSDNYGFWAVVAKENGATIGWSGTWTLHETREVEIGFAIAPEFWGRGLATEAAACALEFAFQNRRARRVVAVAMPENKGSRRVMEKLGMRLEGVKFFRSYNLELVYYSLSAEEYLSRSHRFINQGT